MEDPITADFAARNEIEEEEESAIAFKLPDQYKIQPTIDVRACVSFSSSFPVSN